MSETSSHQEQSPPLNERLTRQSASEMLQSQVDACEGLSVTNLEPGVLQPIGDLPPAMKGMSSVGGNRSKGYGSIPGNHETEISQKLLAVVTAGAETFGIVSLKGSWNTLSSDRSSILKTDTKSQLVVTRIGGEPKEGVEVVGVVEPKKGLKVGRSSASDYDKSLEEGAHFTVEFMDDGSIGVKDDSSASGTKLITGKSEEGFVETTEGLFPGEVRFIGSEEMKSMSTKGIGRILKRMRGAREFEPITRLAEQIMNPFDDGTQVLGTWNTNTEQAELILGRAQDSRSS